MFWRTTFSWFRRCWTSFKRSSVLKDHFSLFQRWPLNTDFTLVLGIRWSLSWTKNENTLIGQNEHLNCTKKPGTNSGVPPLNLQRQHRYKQTIKQKPPHIRFLNMFANINTKCMLHVVRIRRIYDTRQKYVCSIIKYVRIFLFSWQWCRFHYLIFFP